MEVMALYDGKFAIGLIVGGAIAIISMVWIIGLSYCPDQPCRITPNIDARTVNSGSWVPFMSGPNTTSTIGVDDLTGSERYYDRQILRAQEAVARATNAIVAYTGLSVLVAFLGTVALVWTLIATRKATQAAVQANSIMRDSQRPWVDFEINRIGPFQRSTMPNHLVFDCSIRLKNRGENVATNVCVRPFVFFGRSIQHELVKNEILSEIKGALPTGLVLFSKDDQVDVGETYMPRIRYTSTGGDGIECYHIFIAVAYGDDRRFTTIKAIHCSPDDCDPKHGRLNELDLSENEVKHLSWHL